MASGTSRDCNGNGTPDECEPGGLFLLNRLAAERGAILNGYSALSFTGGSLAPAGDLNLDGLGDFLVGSTVEVHAIHGDPGLGEGGPKALKSLVPAGGFVLTGFASSLPPGQSRLGPAGDLNGDGIAEIVIGERDATYAGRNQCGGARVLTSRSGAGVTGADRFTVHGALPRDTAGSSVSSGGDMNGDGFDELVIGAPFADPNGSLSGSAFVAFGAPGIAPSGVLDLASLRSPAGFAVHGLAALESVGSTVASAGDVNGDAYPDLIVAARGVSPGGRGGAGRTSVIFGGPSVGSSGSLRPDALNGTNGFNILGDEAFLGYLEMSAGPAGDMNGDGYADIAIGRVRVHVVLGGPKIGESGTMDLSSPPAGYGFAVRGLVNPAFGSYPIAAAAGDVNGDGFEDVLLGIPYVTLNGAEPVGQAYLVYGPIHPADCDGNGIPDSCEVADGTAYDFNANGIPDACEPDPRGLLRPFVRGDANADGEEDVSDAVSIVLSLFAGRGELPCRRAGDANRDDALDLTDALVLLNHIFRAGPPPADPAAACGVDPRPEALSCERFRPCEG